jgi:hypothetical protein
VILYFISTLKYRPETPVHLKPRGRMR